MDYTYTPLPQRERLVLPDGKRVAVVITFNLETWDLVKDNAEPYYAGGPAILPDILPGNVPDYPNYTWREYGQRVGIWRLFDVVDEFGVKPSCTVNAVTCERRREMVDAAEQRGCEILAHNYEQGELLTRFADDPDAEKAVIKNTLAIYARTLGRSARGWLSSSLRGTLNTPRLLAEAGLDFYCDLMNDDQPYWLQTDAGPIVALPYSNEINDFTLVVRRGHTTSEVRDILIEEFDVLRTEGEHSARIMNIGLHPHVSGRAYRVRALREFLLHARNHDDVWWPRREEIVDWFKQQVNPG